MADHDPLHGRQADAGAFEVVRRVQALEGAEQLVRVGHVEARAVVARRRTRCPPPFEPAVDLDAGASPLAGELPGVAHQVLEQDGQQLRVGLGAEPGRDVDLDLPVRVGGDRSSAATRCASSLTSTGCADQLLAAEPGQPQQVVDELGHPLRGGAHALEVVAAPLVQLVARGWRAGPC